MTDITEIKRLADRAAKRSPHNKSEYSKFISFYLDYKSEAGDFLAPLFKQIADEITASEIALPQDHKHHRKNKSSQDATARFAQSVRLLVLNLMHVRHLVGDNLFLAVSRNNNDYGLNDRYMPKFISAKQFIAAFDGMERLGYLHIHQEGYYFSITGDGMRTRIAATPKLIQLFEAATDNVDFTFIRTQTMGEDETIVLKDTEKKRMDYADTPFTRRARETLAKINKVISAHTYKVSLSEPLTESLKEKLAQNHHHNPDHAEPYIDFQAVRLYRIFNEGSFERGGRFYCGWWQNVPKNFRPLITIDGKPTKELDYSRFHVSILYAELGMPLTFDAYDIHPKVNEEVSKEAVNALISAAGMPDPLDDFDEEQSGISWRDFVALIKRKHAPLVEANMLMKSYGLSVQYKDAQLAEQILLHFAEQGIPCLPIHDSFIVQEDKAEELRAVMLSAYGESFGQEIRVKP